MHKHEVLQMQFTLHPADAALAINNSMLPTHTPQVMPLGHIRQHLENISITRDSSIRAGIASDQSLHRALVQYESVLTSLE